MHTISTQLRFTVRKLIKCYYLSLIRHCKVASILFEKSDVKDD